MMRSYEVGGERLDSVDLKALLVSRGVSVSGDVYRALAAHTRLCPDPLTCNCMILPDGTIVQLTDLAFHMSYVRSAISWDLIRQLKYFTQLKTPFTIERADPPRAALCHEGHFIAEVSFPARSDFYRQTTSSGLPFLGNAVLQGTEWLSFQCLWPCDYACAGRPCQYCYSGGVFEALTRKGKPLPPFPTPQDAAEIAHFAIVREGCASNIQITGGSTFSGEAECDLIRDYLEAIDRRVGRENVTGEIVVYATPPTTPRMLDRIFAAGADRVSMSLEIWDEDLARAVMPGKSIFTGRRRHLECLEYVAATYGAGTACSNFIIGLEPAESCLEGAEYLAARGIVPIASVWIPFGRPVMGSMRAPGVAYYQQIKRGLADIYERYDLEPPGGTGLNVCMCKDIHLHRRAILAA
jgi:Radical SAM superfamily